MFCPLTVSDRFVNKYGCGHGCSTLNEIEGAAVSLCQLLDLMRRRRGFMILIIVTLRGEESRHVIMIQSLSGRSVMDFGKFEKVGWGPLAGDSSRHLQMKLTRESSSAVQNKPIEVSKSSKYCLAIWCESINWDTSDIPLSRNVTAICEQREISFESRLINEGSADKGSSHPTS